MPNVVTDTQALVWYLALPSQLSRRAADLLQATVQDGFIIHVPTMSLVELEYLTERGRVAAETIEEVERALDDPWSGLVAQPLTRDIARAVGRIPRSLVSDPADRIIAATALHLNLPLVRSDRRIHASVVETVW